MEQTTHQRHFGARQLHLLAHNRDGASLLAAFHAASDPKHPGEGIDYLKEAARNFPGDPQVQWTVLAQDAFPEDRRKWLRLKISRKWARVWRIGSPAAMVEGLSSVNWSESPQTLALQSLGQNTSYDFLGGKTPAQRLEELKQQKLGVRALSASLVRHLSTRRRRKGTAIRNG